MSSFGRQKRLGWTIWHHLFSTFFLACLQFCSSPMISALIPRDFRKRTWSNISETSGEIARTIHFAHFGLTIVKNSGGDWKIKYFPNPFCWITNTSWPPTAISSASRCRSIWNVSKMLLFTKAINATCSAILFTMIRGYNLCTDLCPTKICERLSDWLRLTKESSRVQPYLRGRCDRAYELKRTLSNILRRSKAFFVLRNKRSEDSLEKNSFLVDDFELYGH